ncbi:MAG: hypothetical protein ABI675_26735 [Chitinophagaceae bacterium]
MANVSLTTILAEVKKGNKKTDAMDKKLSAIDARLKSIERDIQAVKKFVAVDNADFTISRKGNGGSKPVHSIAAKGS